MRNLLSVICTILLLTLTFSAFAADYNCTWTSVTPGSTCKGSIANYTLVANTLNTTGADFLNNAAVVITFPSGFNLNTCTSGTVNGTNIASIITTPATISFSSPVAVAINMPFTVVLNNVTNNSSAGSYQLSMAIVNSTGGNDIFATGVSSQFTINNIHTVFPTASPSNICIGDSSQLNVTSSIIYTQVYHITSGNLLNCPTYCGAGGNGYYSACSSATPGFQWADIGTGTVTSIQIQFGQGLECANVGTLHTTKLNNVSAPSYSTTIKNCYCTYTVPPVITIIPTTTNYIVGGTNTFLINVSTCMGFQNTGALGADYAQVTVTYNQPVTPTYSWTPTTFLNNPNIANPLASNVTTTTIYTVTGIVNGCSADSTVTITAGSLPSASVTPPSASICIGLSSMLSANITGGAPPYTYSWTPGGATTQSITVSPGSTTIYHLTVTDHCGSTNSASSTVTIDNPIPFVSKIPSSGVICSTGSVTLTASGTANSYVWSPADGLNTITGSTVIASPINTTTYTVTGISTGPSAPITYTRSFTGGQIPTTECTAWNNFRAQLTAASYSKLTMKGSNDPTGISITDPIIVGQIATALHNGTFATWSYGGRTWAVGPCLSGIGISASNTNDVCTCNSPSYVIRPCDGDVHWGGINGAVCYPLSQVMTLEFETNCTNSTTVTVIVQPALTITATATPDTVCSGGSSQLNAASIAHSTRVYHIGLGNLINVPNTSYCPGAPYASSGGNPGFTWTDVGTGTVTSVEIQFGQGIECCTVPYTHTTKLNNVSAPSYTITEKNCYCPVPNQAVITVNPSTVNYIVGGNNTFIINNPTNPLGFQNTSTLGADYAKVTVTYDNPFAPAYSWTPTSFLNNPNISNPLASPVTISTNYTVTGTANGCTSTQAVSVIVGIGSILAQPGAISGNTIACNGSANTYSIAAVTGATSYTWILPSGWTGTSSTTSINTVAGATGGTITVTANNACGSSLPQPLAVYSVPAVPGPVIGSSSICQGSTQTYSINAVPGATSYLWTVPTGWTIQSGQGTISISVTSNNTSGDVIVTAGNTCGTSTADTLNVTASTFLPVSVVISAGSNPACAGDTVTFSAVPTNGGISPVYQWFLNGVPAGTNSNTYANSGLANNDVITCHLTSSETCATGNPATSNAVTMTINANLPASISITASANPICAGTSVTFTATPVNGGIAPTYQWRLNGTNVGTNSPTYTNAAIQNNDHVKCWMASSAACVTGSPSGSNVIIMTVNPLPVFNLGPDTIICNNQSFTLDAGTGYSASYLWSDNSTNQTLVVNGGNLGIGTWPISVIVTNSHNCHSGDTIVIIVSSCTGVNDTHDHILIQCYPNPVNGILNISIEGINEKEIELVLNNIYSQLLYQEKMSTANGSISKQLDLAGYSKGVYFLELYIGNNLFVNKIIIE